MGEPSSMYERKKNSVQGLLETSEKHNTLES
jgi:hypothetical protein